MAFNSRQGLVSTTTVYIDVSSGFNFAAHSEWDVAAFQA